MHEMGAVCTMNVKFVVLDRGKEKQSHVTEAG